MTRVSKTTWTRMLWPTFGLRRKSLSCRKLGNKKKPIRLDCPIIYYAICMMVSIVLQLWKFQIMKPVVAIKAAHP